jgi:membrane associated rhomboid family serine protease
VIPIPYRDELPRTRPPVVTITIIVLNVAAFAFELWHGIDLSTLEYGAIPAWILHHRQTGVIHLEGVGRVILHQEVPPPYTILTSMFLHGGWLHIIGNLWFLWIFGDNVEDAMGRRRYALFYLACGIAAALTQIVATPTSAEPMVGASGAIAGVLGAYAVTFPRARVRCIWILIIFITTITLPAWVLLGLWFLSQFFLPLGSGVAWMAHVGGFVVGALLMLVLRQRRPRPGARRSQPPVPTPAPLGPWDFR